MSKPPSSLMPQVSLQTASASFPEFYVHLPKPAASAPDENGLSDETLQSHEIVVSDGIVVSDDPGIAAHGTASTVRPADYFRVKVAVDRAITTALTILALPLIATVASAIVLLDGRPVFYRQRRVGMHGCDFWIWKFRTMKHDAESATGAVWSHQSDPRVTPLGRWLRCSHLDELPQFFNVLAGEMSLVGPRPERPEFAQQLARELTNYMQRTAVRPGITGLAQLRLGYDHSVADVRKKLKLDLRYIRTTTCAMDLWLLTCTLPYIARQLTHKWIAGRRSLAESVAQSEAKSGRLQLVAPTLCCHSSAHMESSQSVPCPGCGATGNPDLVAADKRPTSSLKVLYLDRAEKECA